MLSFKHLLAAAFVVGSLLSSTAQAKLSDYATVKALAAATSAGAVYYLVSEHKAQDNESAFKKTLTIASKVIKAPINFYAEKKDGLHAAAAAFALVYHGKAALNTAKDAAHFFGIKAPALYAFYASPRV